ncbi:MAG: class I tRNA ligase family protein, partial [Acidobacteriota bacterium]|nr:class I tRNA ligase family protein [Acidobacteriota bacterium]
MPEKPYDFHQIELKWHERWRDQPLYRAEENSSKPKYYVLEMLPYPSGALHIGHIRNYSIGDALARYQWMRGYNVLHPMGWDAFGLPAENAAIANQTAPGEWTRANIARMKTTHSRFAFSYDWDREVTTCEPEYYRWNQWFFLKMLERGLAYRKKALVNWCPLCATVLANEQVVDGCCWRHESTSVEQRALEQWFLRTTHYADALLDDIKQLEGNWPDRVLTMQRNWIGRSEGTEIDFGLIRVFTTRVDTIYGATCLILAPEHPLVQASADPRAKVMIDARAGQDPGEIVKEGFFTGQYEVNPFSGEKIPVWVGNFVLMGYGTGAIMAVPGHDQRDFEFCTKYGIPVRPVIRPADGALADPAHMTEAFGEDGILEDSGEYSGLTSMEARRRMNARAEREGFG